MSLKHANTIAELEKAAAAIDHAQLARTRRMEAGADQGAPKAKAQGMNP